MPSRIPWLLPGWLVGVPEMRSGAALFHKSREPGMRGGGVGEGGGFQVLMSSTSQSPKLKLFCGARSYGFFHRVIRGLG